MFYERSISDIGIQIFVEGIAGDEREVIL